MKNLKSYITILFVTVSFFAEAQETRFFMPNEIEKAYENGTRSFDGKPGPNYWQNTVDYDIEVEVVPETRALSGSGTVTFYNNSPDDLPLLVIRLYHDVFRKGNQRASQVRETDVNDGMVLKSIIIDGDSIDLEENTQRSGTNMALRLPQPVASGSTVSMDVVWEMTVPETTIRTGAYDSSAFFISYWYPQVAVYDDVFGWDEIAYDFHTEFYNNLGNFEVDITVPKTFTVMATGVLQNPDEVFFDEKLDLYNEANSTEETITIISAEDISNKYAHKSGTWSYKADDVTDFSFCLSDHHMWDAASQPVGDRNVFISSFYNVRFEEQANALTSIQQQTMYHFSNDVPGVPYPYPEFTSCVMGGGGGMETPMMANNGGPGRGVTVHEMFHTYFPMYVRINEKRWAWMDEGWADFNTSYVINNYFEGGSDNLIVEGFNTSVGGNLGTYSDIPLITSSQYTDNTNYGYTAYRLPDFLYSILHHHLGDELFRACYKDYITTWAQKSPTPYDFFYTFERVSGQDLSWLWKPWFFSYGDVDLKIAEFKKKNLTIMNSGTRPVPVVVEVTYNDSTKWDNDFPASVWKGENSYSVEIPNWKEVLSISLNGSIPDANSLDNHFPSIKDRYKDFTVSPDYIGTFSMTNYNLSARLFMKDGIFTTTLLGTDSYLIPKSENTYESLSGDIIVNLTSETDGTVNISMELKYYGVTLVGSKD